MYLLYLEHVDPLHMSPVDQPLLLDQQPPPHVPAVEDGQLNIVIMDVDKTEDDSADNTETKDNDNDIDFLLDGVISETKENNKIWLFLIYWPNEYSLTLKLFKMYKTKYIKKDNN